MAGFEEATRVVPRAAAGEFDAELDGQWSVSGAMHGGYLLSVLGRAASEVAGAVHPHPVSMSATFVQAPKPGPVVVAVETLRVGRSATHLRARMTQGGATAVEALVVNGELSQGDAWWSGIKPVELPPAESCVRVPVEPPGVGMRVELMEVVEERLDPAVLGFTAGRATGVGRVAGHLRLADGADWDPLSLLVALDIGPPASFDLGIGGRAPTMQLSAYLRGLPAPGPLRFEQRAGEVSADRMDEVMTIWDSKDRLVGQANQLALVRTPDGPPPGT